MSLVAGNIGEKVQCPDGIQVDHLSENTVGHGVRVRGISDPTTYPVLAGDVGESKQSLGSDIALTTNQWADGGSAGLPLGLGVWLVWMTARIVPAASTAMNRIMCGVGTVSGNDATGLDMQKNSYRLAISTFAPNPNDYVVSTPPFVVAGGTTYYPKSYVTFSTSTCTANNSIFAIRIA
jgi:hypothetical protein